ncbi:MAG TPA: co-chaperone GroES [Anaeromyxobacteraceae bacterium]|nr:co-chaperone GroES [Anaeromyxobacteraceae bacterium]
MDKLRPLGDGVLVRVAQADATSQGGIIIPDAAKEKQRRGEVLAAGPGRWVAGHQDGQAEHFHPVGVLPGEVVLYDALAGVDVGPDLLLLRESDILAVVEK